MSQDPIRIVNIADIAPREAVAQMHGDRRVGVHIQVLENTPERFVAHTRYDPGLILARHSHKSDFIVFIIEGEVRIGDRDCLAGALIVVDRDVNFGPLVAGPDGCTLLESYSGDVTSVHENDDIYHQMLAERGIVPVAPSSPT